MAAKKKPRQKRVVLIEAISADDQGQEMPILREFFRMLNWPCDPRDASDQGSPEKNKTLFLKALLRTRSRFIHVSAHGSGSDLTLDRYGPNEADIELDDITAYCRKRKLRDPLSGRFITISACGDIAPSFALGLNEHAGATAVITPLARLDFHESALFAMMFYFTLLAPRERKKKHMAAGRRSRQRAALCRSWCSCEFLRGVFRPSESAQVRVGDDDPDPVGVEVAGRQRGGDAFCVPRSQLEGEPVSDVRTSTLLNRGRREPLGSAGAVGRTGLRGVDKKFSLQEGGLRWVDLRPVCPRGVSARWRLCRNVLIAVDPAVFFCFGTNRIFRALGAPCRGFALSSPLILL